jgi:hypothetical protein
MHRLTYASRLLSIYQNGMALLTCPLSLTGYPNMLVLISLEVQKGNRRRKYILLAGLSAATATED